MSDISRAQFLRGNWGSNKKSSIRPPWSKLEDFFIDNCTRCGDCIKTCPEKIISKGSGGFPIVDFNKGGCSFCYECAKSCQYDLFISKNQKPWDLNIKIKDNCLSKIGVVCQSCADVCEHNAINFSLQIGGVPDIKLDINKCTACGECVSICPKNSIEIKQI